MGVRERLVFGSSYSFHLLASELCGTSCAKTCGMSPGSPTTVRHAWPTKCPASLRGKFSSSSTLIADWSKASWLPRAVVDQGIDGHASSTKTRSASQDFRIAHNDGLVRHRNLSTFSLPALGSVTISNRSHRSARRRTSFRGQATLLLNSTTLVMTHLSSAQCRSAVSNSVKG
jgi:hypothetical protein